MLARPDFVLLLIAAVIFTHVWRLHDVTHAPAVRPTLLLGLALVAAGLSTSIPLLGRRLQSSILALLALMIVVAAAGLPFALDTEGSTRYLTTWVMPTVLLAALVAVAVRSGGDVEWLLLTLLAAAATYLAILYARGGVNAVNDPSATVFYDRNELALMLVALVPPALHFARPGEGGIRRAFAAACLVAFIFTIVRGGSRGGLVGLIAALAYVLVTFRGVPRSVRVWTAIAAAVLLAGAGSTYWARMGTMLEPTSDYNVSHERTGRVQLWRRGVQYVRERPLAGVGVGGFPVAERELSSLARRRDMVGKSTETLNAHNIFIQVAAELGLVGLALFVGLLVQATRTLMRLRRRHDVDPQVSTIAHVLLASLLGYVVCGVFLSAAYFPLLYVIVGLAAGLAAAAPPVPAPVRQARGGRQESRVASPRA
jgi:O-antigen ligase